MNSNWETIFNAKFLIFKSVQQQQKKRAICKSMDSIIRPNCKVIIGRNPIEAIANTVAIQLPGNPVAYIGKYFTPY